MHVIHEFRDVKAPRVIPSCLCKCLAKLYSIPNIDFFMNYCLNRSSCTMSRNDSSGCQSSRSDSLPSTYIMAGLCANDSYV